MKIDTRNSYKIWKNPEYNSIWQAYFHPWYWPFWQYITCGSTEEEARKICNDHALKPSKDEGITILLGRLP